MGNQPIYRYPPRSHAAACRCDRCLPFKPKPGVAGTIEHYGLIGPLLLWGGLVAVAGFWPAMVWHGEGGPTGNDWRWDIHSTIAELVYFGTIGFVVLMCWLGNRPAKTRPPKGRLRVEATAPGQLRPPPASVCVPRCLHENAVRVAGAAWPQETLENWCPGCDAQLGAAFRWSCCGAPPGDRPGEGHVYNCPNWKEDQ